MATKSKAEQAPATNKPVKVFRLRGVKVSVFENHSDSGQKFFKVTSPQKIYKEGEAFKTASSLGRDDLPVARHLLHLAWTFILEAETQKDEA